MPSICAVVTFHRNAEVIERFRSRISFKDGLESFNNFKLHVEGFLGVREKARDVGINSFELKFFRLVQNGNDCLIFFKLQSISIQVFCC